MKKEIKEKLKEAIIYIFTMVVVILLAGLAFNSVDKNYQEVYDAGYSEGYQAAVTLKIADYKYWCIADYKYWCEDKYGWVPYEP